MISCQKEHVNYLMRKYIRHLLMNSTLKDINTWVSQKTEKMIPQILDKIEDNSVMYLINAIAFDAKWQSPYEKEDVAVRHIYF